MTAGWVSGLVGEAKAAAAFKELPAGRVKTDTVWLLELCVNPARRPAAIQALEWVSDEREKKKSARPQAVRHCRQLLGDGVRWKGEGEAAQAQAEPARVEEAERVELLKAVVESEPYVYEPPVTVAYAPDRHPWHGHVGEMTFMEFAAGIGVFAACFAAAGMRCECIAEPKVEARGRAVELCGGVRVQLDSAMDVDPVDLPWVHGLVGGPECQPFSVAGKGRGFADERAYTLIRALHIAAAMQPWWVWMENVKAIESAQDGKVWKVVQGIAAGSGFKIRLTQV